MGLTAEQHRGLHGEAYVFAMASAAGLLVWSPNADLDGVDWLIGHPGPMGSTRSPMVGVQVKTRSTPELSKEGHWCLRLEADSFNNLAGRFAVPRYLVLVTAPHDVAQLAQCDDDCMILRQAAYWVSLADRTPFEEADPQKSVTVHVPRAHTLTPETLRALVAGDLGRGEQP